LIYIDNLFGNQVNMNPLLNQNRNEVHNKDNSSNNTLMNNSASILGNNPINSMANNLNGIPNYGNSLGSGLGSNY